MRTIGSLRCERRHVVQDIGHIAAVNSHRAREHHPWAIRLVAASFEDFFRTLQIDAHAFIEIRLGFPADDGRKVKYGTGVFVDELVRRIRFTEVAVAGLQSLVIGERLNRWPDVGHQNFIDAFFIAAGGNNAAPVEQRVHQARTEKARSTGNQYLHQILPPRRINRLRGRR